MFLVSVLLTLVVGQVQNSESTEITLFLTSFSMLDPNWLFRGIHAYDCSPINKDMCFLVSDVFKVNISSIV